MPGPGCVPGPGGVPGPEGVWSQGGAWSPHRTATAAGGTHLTGMHSCYLCCPISMNMNTMMFNILKLKLIITVHLIFTPKSHRNICFHSPLSQHSVKYFDQFFITCGLYNIDSEFLHLTRKKKVTAGNPIESRCYSQKSQVYHSHNIFKYGY